MTLQEAIWGVMRLIDEDVLEEDLRAKLLSFLDMGQKEIVLQAPILRELRLSWPPVPPPALEGEQAREEWLLLPVDYHRASAMYALHATGAQALYSRWNEMPDGRVCFEDAGAYCLVYEAYPETIDEQSPWTQALALPTQAHTALLFYAAAQYALSDGDYSAQYGKFYAMYQGRMANLMDERRRLARVVGGLSL